MQFISFCFLFYFHIFLFFIGSNGTTFYIILKGSISIYITPKHPESNSPQLSPKRISIMPPKKKSMLPAENFQNMISNITNSLFAVNKMEMMKNQKLSLSPTLKLQSKEVVSLDPNNLKSDVWTKKTKKTKKNCFFFLWI